MIKVDNKFDFGEVVYQIVDFVGDEPEPMAGQIVGMKIFGKETAPIVYEVDWADGKSSAYYDYQLTDNKFYNKNGDDEEDHE